jgi:hypothetical protein
MLQKAGIPLIAQVLVTGRGELVTNFDRSYSLEHRSIKVIQGLIQRVHRGTILPMVRVIKITFHQEIPMHPKVATI